MAEQDQAKKKKRPKKRKKTRSYRGKALLWIFVLLVSDEVTPGIPFAEVLMLSILFFLPRWFLNMVHRVYEYVPRSQAWRSVGDICQRQVVTVPPDTPVIDVARLMRDEHVRSLVVVEKREYLPTPEEVASESIKKKGGKGKRAQDKAVSPGQPRAETILVPVGILTDRDIALRVEAEGLSWSATTVAEVMTTNLAVAVETEDVHSVVEKMGEVGARQLPVVDRRGEIVGTLSLDETIAMLSDSLDDMVELLQREIQREAEVNA